MKRLTPRGVRVLKMFHLLCLSVWIGAGVALVLLMAVGRPSTVAEASMQARMLQLVDLGLVASFAFALLATGLVYSLFTQWGFTKFWWIIVKWALIVFQILFGTFVVGAYIGDNLALTKSMTGELADYPQYFDNLDKASIAGAVQLVLLVFVVFVSVWKPWGRTRRAARATS